MLKRTLLKYALGAMVVTLALAPPALADSTIKVSLWNKSGEMDMSKNMMMGMGMHGTMMAMMGIDVDVKSVPAGKVTFEATNASKDMIHEMILAPIKDETTPLPYNEKEFRVEEEAAGSLGEVSELDPGKTGALTLDLKPGTYILYCNIAGHYQWGMWTTVKVE